MIDILDESYESDLTDEESVQLLLRSEHAIGPKLSPAALAVLNAYRDAGITDYASVAAVLRAVVANFATHKNIGPYLSQYEILNAAKELEKLDELA